LAIAFSLRNEVGVIDTGLAADLMASQTGLATRKVIIASYDLTSKELDIFQDFAWKMDA
jgi:hypothetical protein